MQRVLQRAKRASRVVERAKAKEKKAVQKAERQERNERRVTHERQHNESIRQARRNRREDWELGPLAPRRDVGENAHTYAAVSPFFMQQPAREPSRRPKWQHIAIGDRVVLTRGLDKGRVGSVKEYNEDSATVTITGVNMIDAAVPAWMHSIDNPEGETAIVALSRPLPIEDVRLVYPLPDPETGIIRDVVIEQLEKVEIAEDQKQNNKPTGRGYRAIPGTNTIIPWPVEAEAETPEAFPGDTLRIDVDEQTLRPTLLYHPMPPSVIDELRNKYSRFRTRHDFDFVAKMEALEEKENARKGLIQGMKTPLQELAELRARKKSAEERDLSEEDLAKIGRVMAEQGGITGVIKETSAPSIS